MSGEYAVLAPVLATWVIRSKTSPSRQRKIFFPCLQTQEGGCTIRSRHQQTHARTTILSQDGEASCMAGVLTHLQRLKDGCLHALYSRFTCWTKPLGTSFPLATLTDLGRSKSELIAENALLRQQLIILKRQVKRPTFTRTDRILLVLLARLVRTWQQALVIVQPDTRLAVASGALSLVLEAQVKGSCSQAEGRRRNDCLEKTRWRRTIAVFGAERIRGELLKLGLRVCKRTIQKYMRQVRTTRPRGQTWTTFLHTHAANIWACDFLQVTDLFFRPLFAFFLIELKTRRVIHVGVTRSPSDAWVAQHLREATPYGQAPKYLICDNDSKFGPSFARVARTNGIKILKMPYHAPRANAICERFLRSVRQECVDHLLILGEKQLQRVLNAYVVYFNQARPHQGMAQQIPEQRRSVPSAQDAGNKVIALPVVGGLHHDYHLAA
jgi:transposase InsO family protein